MNRNLKTQVSLLLIVFMLFTTGLYGYAAKDEVKDLVPQYVTTTDKTFETSQFNSRFPEENPTSRIYAQSRRVFEGYEGRGAMIIENHSAKSVKVYINGNRIHVNDYLKDEDSKTVIDISKYTVNGDNTLKVLNVYPKESYINITIPYPELIYGEPEECGFSKYKLSKIDKLINDEVKKGFPGAVLLVMKDGKIVKNTAYGYKLKYDGAKLLKEPQSMKNDTIFDLASNSKMFATNLALEKLVSENKIDIDELVCTYIPDFKGQGRENIKIRDLLNHRAGFASSIRFYTPNKNRNKYGEEFYSHDRERTLELLEKAPLEYPTGTKNLYSDTDYMLLGYVIEKITGQRLDEYVENNIYKPLGLTHTMFNPLDNGIKKEDCAATETQGNTRGLTRQFPDIRNYTLQGQVHDEKAFYSMDGVSGHAGLFSTTEDMAVLCQLILNNGSYGNIKIYDKNVGDQFNKPSDNNITYGLGWRRAGNADRIWHFSPYASNMAIGHTGWTGTVTVIDPKHDMAVILLTNKKHSICKEGKFEGDSFETAKYGSIISLVYESLLENN